MQNEQIGWVDFVCEGLGEVLILDSQTKNEFWDVWEDWGEDSINKPCNGMVAMPIELAESMSVNLEKKVSMNVFTLENSKTAKGMGREP